ncbi:hypothetical protein AB0N05_35325 [Nocardia sp. NPDC051030]
MTDLTTQAATAAADIHIEPPESSEVVMGMLRATVEVLPAPDDAA